MIVYLNDAPDKWIETDELRQVNVPNTLIIYYVTKKGNIVYTPPFTNLFESEYFLASEKLTKEIKEKHLNPDEKNKL